MAARHIYASYVILPEHHARKAGASTVPWKNFRPSSAHVVSLRRALSVGPSGRECGYGGKVVEKLICIPWERKSSRSSVQVVVQ